MSSYQMPTQLHQPSTTSNNLQIKSAYSQKERVRLTFPQHSRWTKQSFKDECDINVLMNRYLSTGQLPNINERAPQYLDTSGYEFQDAMQFVAEASSLFEELPSAIRTRFENDPAEFLNFTSNPENRDEMRSMGLLRDDAPTLVSTSVLKNQTQPNSKISTSEEANSRSSD